MKRVYVGNLPFAAAESEVEAAFAAFGEVRSVTIPRDRETGESRGFAFVEMSDDVHAQAAIDALNGTQMGGRTLTVNEARPQERRPGGPGGGPRGQRFSGGRRGPGRDDAR